MKTHFKKRQHIYFKIQCTGTDPHFVSEDDVPYPIDEGCLVVGNESNEGFPFVTEQQQ
jgi:hypothetical protein